MKTSTFKKMLIASASAAVLAAMPMAASAQDNPGEGTTIRMAQPTWDTAWFETEVYKQVFEELGYTVDGPTSLDNPLFYQAVAQGDVDLWVSGWFPLHNTYLPTIEGSAEVIGAVAEGGALEGYLVSAAAAEEFGITSLEDFKRDEVKEAFDRDGDGRADMVACPPGWGCELNIEHHLDAYELRDHVNPIKASYSASMADAIAAHEAGEPILFYTWTPNWTVDALVPGEDVVWIEVPEVDLPGDLMELADAATLEGVTGCVNDPCMLGFPANDIQPVASTAFLEANPAVRAILENASIPVADIFAQNALMNEGEGSAEDVARHASEWIENNRETVDGWLEAARNAS
jgi:glycine betaine/proline transport system substrate-binding protein